jgi:FMN-dependent NADH-azoreductase
MTTLLHLDSSPRSACSGSRLLTREFIDAFIQVLPDTGVIYRNLAAQPPALIDEPWITAAFTPPSLRTPEMCDLLHESDVLIDELLAADLIIIGAPMHNFGVGTLLKCYIDQIVRAGRTYEFTPAGPRGLVAHKRVVVVMTRGSDYSGAAMAALDFQRPYLTALFSFLGIEDVTFISCEGMDAGKREQSMEAARRAIPLIVSRIVEPEGMSLELAAVV